MAETTAGAAGLSAEQEDQAFYHEAALNATWTGTRLMIGVMVSGLGGFVFSFFYLRSLNSHGLWYENGFTGPSQWQGGLIMGLVVVSAILQTLGLQAIKRGQKSG